MTTTRIRGIALLLTVLVAALGLTGCLGSGPDKQERARANTMLSSALSELAGTPAVHYRGTPPGSAAGTAVDMHVTSSGASLGTVQLGGTHLRVLAVDGKRFVLADAAFWNRHGVVQPSLARAYARRWVQIGRRSIAGFPELRTPAQLAAWVRKTADPDAAQASEATVHGVRVTRIDLGDGAVYLSAASPRRVIRLQGPQKPAGGARTAMVLALPVAMAASPPAPGSGVMDISEPDAEQSDALFDDMKQQVDKLDNAVDSQVRFTNAPAFSCAQGGRCTASTSANIVTGEGQASGTVHVTLNASMTALGQTLQCSAVSTVAPNATARLSCGASFQLPRVSAPVTVPVVGRLYTTAKANIAIPKIKKALVREQGRNQRAVQRRPNAADAPPKKPSKKACSTAIKLLTDYARVYEKVKKRPMPRKVEEQLDAKREAGTITSNDLPGSIQRNFPGELEGYTLDEIRALCK